MKYFKNKSNVVFAFKADGSQDSFITSNMTAITEAEALALASPPPTFGQVVESIRSALQSAIDTRAKALGFSSGNALMLYAGFESPFRPIAQVFATWEASVWVQAEAYKEEVIAGTKPLVSPEQAVVMMPVYPDGS